jgi:hypothetical protein
LIEAAIRRRSHGILAFPMDARVEVELADRAIAAS